MCRSTMALLPIILIGLIAQSHAAPNSKPGSLKRKKTGAVASQINVHVLMVNGRVVNCNGINNQGETANDLVLKCLSTSKVKLPRGSQLGKLRFEKWNSRRNVFELESNIHEIYKPTDRIDFKNYRIATSEVRTTTILCVYMINQHQKPDEINVEYNHYTQLSHFRRLCEVRARTTGGSPNARFRTAVDLVRGTDVVEAISIDDVADGWPHMRISGDEHSAALTPATGSPSPARPRGRRASSTRGRRASSTRRASVGTNTGDDSPAPARAAEVPPMETTRAPTPAAILAANDSCFFMFTEETD